MGRRWITLVLLLPLPVVACGRLGFDAAATPDGGGSGGDPSDGMAHLTIHHTGAGTGTIVGPNGFTCTTGTCSLAVVPETSVTLRGLAATDNWFAGWTGPCGGNFDCTFDATGDTTLDAELEPTPNRMFVTSTTTDGNMGGVAGADAICAARATAADLHGTFVAFLSSTTSNATSRVTASRGWVRTDGAPFADAPAAFASGNIIFPPRLDEYGNDLGSVLLFTGTNRGAVGTTCADWTDNTGTSLGGGTESEYAASSIGAYDVACSNTAHLMCVETGRVQPVQIHPDTGKLAFASTTKWTPGSGRDSADALCASDATAAGLPGTFLAALATTTETVASRFSADSLYRRVDGVRLLRSSGMLVADWIDVPPELDAFGRLVENDLWTGALRFDTLPAAGDDCSDWSDGSSAQDGYMQFTSRTELRTPEKTDLCSSNVELLCLEQ